MDASDKVASVASTRSAPLSKRATHPRSKARGLRTRTGCLTCRQRRVKCDEDRPRCGHCLRGHRNCVYQSIPWPGESIATNSTLRESRNPSHSIASPGEPSDAPQSISPPCDDVLQTGRSTLSTPAPVEEANLSRVLREDNDCSSAGDGHFRSPVLFTDINHVPNITDSLRASAGQVGRNSRLVEEEQTTACAISPLLEGSSYQVSLGAAPFDWYQLLAQDALRDIEEYSLLTNESNWDFDPTILLQLPNHIYSSPPPQNTNNLGTTNSGTKSTAHEACPVQERRGGDTYCEPWNSTNPIVLEPDEVVFFKHFTKCVGPILDLFDPANHFSETVPHLALRNIGLMKSMLAVAARSLSLDLDDAKSSTAIDRQTSSSFTHGPRVEKHLAVQYYYETLRYLSQAMQYPSYIQSSEILATAIMISTYEMFDDDSSDWERHLRGAYWIQRTQDNDGESSGVQKAVWWAWLRQDIWAAFRHKRRTMTIWRPSKPLTSLGPDELANRSTYLLAKAIEYISDDGKRSQDLPKRIKEGEMHLKSLETWYESLPVSFSPIAFANVADSLFKPIWIHPLRYSASVQIYCLAKLVILINMPSSGGIDEYNERQKTLEEVVNMICGLAQAPDEIEPPRALINIQCLFVAGQCTRARNRQVALLRILEGCMVHCKWLQSSLVDDLNKGWGNS